MSVVFLQGKRSYEVRDEVLKSMVAEHPHAGRGDLIGWTDLRLGPAGWAQEQKPEVPRQRFGVQCALSLRRSGDGQGWKGSNRPRPAGFTVLEDVSAEVTMVSFEQPRNWRVLARPACHHGECDDNRPAYRMPSGAPVIVLAGCVEDAGGREESRRGRISRDIWIQLQPGPQIGRLHAGAC